VLAHNITGAAAASILDGMNCAKDQFECQVFFTAIAIWKLLIFIVVFAEWPMH
jgi:hypothetical protein